MFRRIAAIVLVVILAAIAWTWRMAPLTVSIGSGPIALVQSGAVVRSFAVGEASSAIQATLPVASTAGTTLIAIWGNPNGGTPTVSASPAGWTRLVAVPQSTTTDFEIWAYYNNPGGISLATFTGAGLVGFNSWRGAMSEWANVASVTTLETSGTATATSGFTLTPTTTGNVVSTGDLAISAWIQACAGGTVTDTSPAGWTRLIDNSTEATSSHMAAEYLPSPPVGSTLGPTLTSSVASTSAAGATIVLRAVSPTTDMTAYLKY